MEEDIPFTLPESKVNPIISPLFFKFSLVLSTCLPSSNLRNGVSHPYPNIFKIVSSFRSVPSLEHWSEGHSTSTLKQISYYWESGYFKEKRDAILVCEQLIETFEILKKQAAAGNKLQDGKKELEDNGAFSLYQSEIEIGNNCILVSAENQKRIYLRHQTFNYLYTADVEFCESTSNWIDNLIRKADLISGVSEKKRERFFGKMKEEVHALIKEIR